VEGAAPPATALFDDPVGPPSEESTPTLKPPAAQPVSRLRRHPALWFVAGSACTLLAVLLVQGGSGESNGSSADRTALRAETTTAKPSPDSRPEPGDLVATSPEVIGNADSTAAPTEDLDDAAEVELADDEAVEPGADREANASPAPVKVQRPRSRPKSSKKKTFIPKGL
jgi:hypothetical protein